MSGGAQTPPASSPWASVLAHAALSLYPAAWQARYGDEIRILLDDSGADLRTVVSLVWRAMPAWVWPARHLYDRPARMRASLATVLLAWTALTGLALVFAQLTQAQGLRPPGHPVIQWSYWIFDGGVAISVLALAVGAFPLWLLMMRRAHREHRPREMAYLLSPVIVPVVYLTAVIVIARFVRHADGIGPWWFLAVVVLGFAAGGVFAAGPGLALHRLRPRGPAVSLAVNAAGIAATAISLAGAASIVAAVGLCLWAPQYAGYHVGWPLGIYLPLVLLTAAVATVSAARGIRAARPAAAA
jgi:MFS family permease